MLIISFFSLLILLCKEEIADGQENNRGLNPGGQVIHCKSYPDDSIIPLSRQVIHCKICLDDSIPLRLAISISGKEVSEKELGAICGKGLGGYQATGAEHSGLSGKIILWDEVKASNAAGIEFSNRGNSMSNAQKNSLIIHGK